MGGHDRLIDCSRDLHHFSQRDEKQQKTSVSRCPKPTLKVHTAATIQAWCFQFHAQAKTCGLRVNNCFCLRKLTNNPKGFTCCDDSVSSNNSMCDSHSSQSFISGCPQFMQRSKPSFSNLAIACNNKQELLLLLDAKI